MPNLIGIVIFFIYSPIIIGIDMNDRLDKKRKFITCIPTLNINSLEFSLTIIETYDEMEIGRYSAILPNPYRIFGYELEFHLN